MTKLIPTLALLLSFVTSAASAADKVSAPSPEPDRPDLSQLSTDEIKTYQRGEITTGETVAGGLIGTFVGLGLGHIVYGEYGSKGWIFTLGEVGSAAVMISGLTNSVVNCTFLNTSGCSNGLGLYTFGAILFVGFRVWEIVDVWTLPSRHNDDYHAIEAKLQSRSRRGSMDWTVLPLVASNHDHWNFGLGVSLRY